MNTDNSLYEAMKAATARLPWYMKSENNEAIRYTAQEWSRIATRFNDPDYVAANPGIIRDEELWDLHYGLSRFFESMPPRPDGHRLTLIDHKRGWVVGNLVWELPGYVRSNARIQPSFKLSDDGKSLEAINVSRRGRHLRKLTPEQLLTFLDKVHKNDTPVTEAIKGLDITLNQGRLIAKGMSNRVAGYPYTVNIADGRSEYATAGSWEESRRRALHIAELALDEGVPGHEIAAMFNMKESTVHNIVSRQRLKRAEHKAMTDGSHPNLKRQQDRLEKAIERVSGRQELEDIA